MPIILLQRAKCLDIIKQFLVFPAIWPAFLHLFNQTYVAFIPTTASSLLFSENMCILHSLLTFSSAQSRGCKFGTVQTSSK